MRSRRPPFAGELAREMLVDSGSSAREHGDGSNGPSAQRDGQPNSAIGTVPTPAHPENQRPRRSGRRPRILAWGQGQERVACLPDRFAYTRSGEWAYVPWDQIDHGGWDGARGVLGWTAADGVAHEAALADPGDVPDVFRELVAASILVQQQVAWPGGSALIVLRRNPSGATPARWRLFPSPGSDPDTPSARRALAQARADWDID